MLIFIANRSGFNTQMGKTKSGMQVKDLKLKLKAEMSPGSKRYMLNNFFRAVSTLIKSDRSLISSLSESNSHHDLKNLDIAKEPGYGPKN